MTDDAYPEAWRPRGLPDTTTPEQTAAEKFLAGLTDDEFTELCGQAVLEMVQERGDEWGVKVFDLQFRR
jgi:hypothetical protein